MKLGKKLACAAVAAAIGLSVGVTGCSLVSTNNRQDMGQVIAEVNISNVDASLKDDAVKTYGESVGASKIIKRDLIAYFINVGTSYINSGYGYDETFNLLLDSIINNEVLTQYATMYLLNTSEIDVNQFNAKPTEAEKYEYLLGGEDSEDVKIAKYSLYSSINSVLDQFEEAEISGSDDDDDAAGTETRATPGNVGTEVEDYYPKKENDELDYGIYTGYSSGASYDYTIDNSGAYKDDALDGTTKKTRQNAYNSFLKRLANNYLISSSEDVKNIESLDYFKEEYVSQLKSRVISHYYDVYEEEVEKKLTEEYLQSEFDSLFNSQKTKNSTSESFVSAMGEMSDSSFLLYAPDPLIEGNKFGFVYNILLPFSAKQESELSKLQAQNGYDSDSHEFDKPEHQNAYYAARNALMQQIKTEDQRTPWINGQTEYAFDSSAEGSSVTVNEKTPYNGGNEGRTYLFFEDNLTKTNRYEPLDKYAGLYTFNGTVVKDKDDKYVIHTNKLDIDQMLDEFTGYVDYVLGNTPSTTTVNKTADYYNTTDFYKEGTDKKEFDYSKLVYATGKVDLGITNSQDNRMNLFAKDCEVDSTKYTASKEYLALSAVNELQYAYTTDTGVLSQYVGYAVSTADDTGFIKEFEYAAQAAVKEGEGAFTVCAGDYGWHLIYCTFTFDKSDLAQYNPDWKRVKQEGTFENLFYEWKKSGDLPNVSSTQSSAITSTYNRKSTVTKYQERYQDLLNYGN